MHEKDVVELAPLLVIDFERSAAATSMDRNMAIARQTQQAPKPAVFVEITPPAPELRRRLAAVPFVPESD